MTDIHYHVLYGIDDGATTIEMSLDMLQSYVAQGVTHVFCTSHSRCTVHRYEKHFTRLQQRIQQEQIPITILKGCEVECSEEEMPEIVKHLKRGFYPTLNGTEYVLMEFEPYDSAETILDCIQYIKQHAHYRPIVADIERYRSVRRNPDLLQTLRGMGCLFQVNMYSLAQAKDEVIKTFARKLAAMGAIDFLGSDAHQTNHRPPAVESGLTYLKETCSSTYCDCISHELAMQLLIDLDN